MEQVQSTGTIKKLRPPIVAVLGHVDHGKTSLLDRIRNTNLTTREVGGITQSTGAWQVEISDKREVISGKQKDGGHVSSQVSSITFIDTPGHEAFQAMRARGARVADLAILVIAADDGVMPQTKQSLQFIRDSQTPFLVAITKIDLPTAQVDKVKNQLLELEVVPEDYGGDTVIVGVSAKTGEGIEALLEMLALMSEINEVSGDPNGELEAYIIEATKDSRKGVVVSLVLKNGTLKVGDILSSEGIEGKARGMFDSSHRPVERVYPGDPVELIGFSVLPVVGAKVTRAGQVKKEVQNQRLAGAKQEIVATEGFPIVLKADTAGSLEAIIGQLSDKVGVITSGIGDISESDVLTAAPQKAVVVGFNVKVGKDILKLAEEEKVLVYTYKIIYELVSEVERWQKEKEKEGKEQILGRAQVIAQFPHGKTRIAGCKLLEGRIIKNDGTRLVRDDQIIGNVRIQSLKKQKEEVGKVEGTQEEFGVYFEPQFDFRLGDVLESYS